MTKREEVALRILFAIAKWLLGDSENEDFKQDVKNIATHISVNGGSF